MWLMLGCCTVLCCAVLCCAVLCCAVLCCAVLCCAMQTTAVTVTSTRLCVCPALLERIGLCSCWRHACYGITISFRLHGINASCLGLQHAHSRHTGTVCCSTVRLSAISSMTLRQGRSAAQQSPSQTLQLICLQQLPTSQPVGTDQGRRSRGQQAMEVKPTCWALLSQERLAASLKT